MPSTDLVVVGFGAAGAATALAAAELGAAVTILEKQPAGAHTPSARMSGGILMGMNDAGRGAAYLDRCAQGVVPEPVSRAWAEKACDLVGWHERIGADLHLQRIAGAEHPGIEGSEAVDVYRQGLTTDGEPVPEEHGWGDASQARGAAVGAAATRHLASIRAGTHYFAAVRAAVERDPRITVRWESPGRRLERSGDGRVAAVLHGAGERLDARVGVVLTTGGFEHSEQLKRDFLPVSPAYFYGNPGNTGDGIRMAQAVGADLWHMNLMFGRAVGRFPMADGSSMNFIIALAPPGYVLTDRYGRRFADEDSQALFRHDFHHQLTAERIPCFWFFDERRRKAGPLTSVTAGAVAVGAYGWSADNSREIERGWIAQGDSIAAAATAAGVEDPAAADATVAAYNESCRSGTDPFRDPGTLVPLDQPPYYCVPLYPGGPNTGGGPRRDEHARILDAYGEVIPGLFGAGNNGQAMGMLYPADGANLSEAVCFGRIAAETALA